VALADALDDLEAAADRDERLRVAELFLQPGAAGDIREKDGQPAVTLGRDPQCDVVITDKMASRMHARIERRRDKFVIVDQSSNGTYVTVDGEREILLRREELILRGKGHISFGHAHQPGTGDAVLRFVCGDALGTGI